jgi:hypothetical protein
MLEHRSCRPRRSFPSGNTPRPIPLFVHASGLRGDCRRMDGVPRTVSTEQNQGRAVPMGLTMPVFNVFPYNPSACATISLPLTMATAAPHAPTVQVAGQQMDIFRSRDGPIHTRRRPRPIAPADTGTNNTQTRLARIRTMTPQVWDEPGERNNFRRPGCPPDQRHRQNNRRSDEAEFEIHRTSSAISEHVSPERFTTAGSTGRRP